MATSNVCEEINTFDPTSENVVATPGRKKLSHDNHNRKRSQVQRHSGII